jgi:beta-lactamase class A
LKRKDRRKRLVEGPRRILIGLSLVLAFAASALVLLLSGSLEGEQEGLDQRPDEMVERGVVAQKAAPVLDPVALHEGLEEVAQGHEGIYGIALLDPDSGTKISLRGEEQFMAASIGKLPVFATLYRAGAQGDLDLQEEIPVLPEDIRDYGEGVIPDPPEDLSGYYTTPDDVLLLLEKISDPQFTSEEFSAEMLYAMTETHLEDRIPEKLPLGVRVAHKTGTYGENFGDAGIVFYEDSRGVMKHYYLVVLVKECATGESEARDAIQSISRVTYEALTGTEVDPSWSRTEYSSSLREEETLDQERTTESYLP